MEKGDFLNVDFISRVAGTNELFETTLADVARQEGIYNEKLGYGPILVVLGEQMMVPGVERQLAAMQVGEEQEFEVAPEDGFGRRDPQLIKIIPLARFVEQKINPVPGAFVNIDGRNARIQSVSGGRVRVDFNHPLAGRPLRYWVKIVSRIERPLEKAIALLRYYGIGQEPTLDGEALVVTTDNELPEPLQRFLKEKISSLIPEIKKIEFAAKNREKKESAQAEK